MKFAVAVHGTRGDVEPCAAVSLELLSRGHEVRFGAPPNLVPFAEKCGLSSVVPYGVDSQEQLHAEIFQKYWKIQNPVVALRELRQYMTQGWPEMSMTLSTLADGADLVLTGTTFQEVAANVAEHHDLPLAALHYFPCRASSYGIPLPLPPQCLRWAMTVAEWGYGRILKDADETQRETLGLPKATADPVRRIVQGGALEIQAYDELFFTGLSEQWSHTRPFVGSITGALETDIDDEVASWMAVGKPPIYFGFGSMPIQSPADTIAMIVDVCAELGERALISSPMPDIDCTAGSEDVKLVDAVNHARTFTGCRAVVHHGGAGTTATGLRAGIPTLILWIGADQPIWANAVRRLKVGSAQRLSRVTHDSLKHALRSVLQPEYAVRAQELAGRITPAATSTSMTADLLEDAVHTRGRVP